MRIDRLNMIEQYVVQCGTASLEDLSSSFHVSMNTIRRDVKELLDRGVLQKVYGGVAVKNNVQQTMPLPMSIRASQLPEAKREIGRLAATLVKDNSSIFLDSGSTTPNILQYLSQKTRVTVITHSLNALYEAAKYPNLRIIGLGGVYYQDTASYVDIASLDALSRMTIDMIFIAATGVSLENGLTNTTFLEAEVKRVVVKRGKKVALMADHGKFDYSSIITFCNFRDLSYVITDRLPPQAYLEEMEKNHIQLLCPETENEKRLDSSEIRSQDRALQLP